MRSSGIIGAISGAGLLGIAAGVSEAAVVVYDNSGGEFEWKLGVKFPNGDVDSLGTFLDITQPPSQSTEQRPGSFGKWFRWNHSSSEPARSVIQGVQSNDAEQVPTIKQTLIWNGMTIKPITIRQYAAGESTSPSHGWEWGATYFYHLPFTPSFEGGTPAIDTLSYLGARVKKNGKYHYGWILFQDYSTPIAWAYETTPDTMITIPAPFLAGVCGLLLLACHRRR